MSCSDPLIIVPSSPSSLSSHFASFPPFPVFPRSCCFSSLFSSDSSSFHFCGSAGVEARVLYRLDNCPPLALKDFCLGWPLEELGCWVCATRQSSYICPFSSPVCLCCRVLSEFGLWFILVDEVFRFCEYVSLAKKKVLLWRCVSKCFFWLSHCDHECLLLGNNISFALQSVPQGSSHCSWVVPC